MQADTIKDKEREGPQDKTSWGPKQARAARAPAPERHNLEWSVRWPWRPDSNMNNSKRSSIKLDGSGMDARS